MKKNKKVIYIKWEQLTDKKNFQPLSFSEEKRLKELTKVIEKFERGIEEEE